MLRPLFLTVALAAGGPTALAADLKSGPQPGEKVPGAFHPLNINGEDAGKRACLYCNAGDSPVVAVFARSADNPALQKLIAALEVETEKHAQAELNSFVVYCSGDTTLPLKLKKFADDAKLKRVILAVEAEEGPEKYSIHKDAEVTVLLYKERVVVANYAFAKGKMTEADVAKIVADIPKIVK